MKRLLAIAGTLSLLWGSVVHAELVKLNDSVLAECADIAGKKNLLGKPKTPKNSQIVKITDIGGAAVTFTLLSPQAQATSFARWATENFVSLDSTNWCPDLFDDGVLVRATALKTMDMTVRMNRIVCLDHNEQPVEPIWTSVDTVQLANLYGANFTASDIGALFPLSLFDAGEQLKFYVFYNGGRKEICVSAKDVKKLR